MSPAYTPTAALAHLPPWLWGHDVLGYASGAQLKVRPKDAATHLWRIHTLERYEKRTPHLVRLIEIAAPNGPANFDRLERLPAMPVEVPVASQVPTPVRHQPVANDADLLARFNWLHVSPALTSDADFIAVARSGFQDLRELTRPDGGACFPDAAAYFMRFDSAVNWRTGLARVLR
jgi:hypothetical protein